MKLRAESANIRPETERATHCAYSSNSSSCFWEMSERGDNQAPDSVKKKCIHFQIGNLHWIDVI